MSRTINDPMSTLITDLQNMVGINQQANLAAVIGSPTIPTEPIVQQITDIQACKNTLAASLSAKGKPSSGTEGLSTLVNKVSSSDIVCVASGSAFNANSASITLNIASLTFKPKQLFIYANSNNFNNDRQIIGGAAYGNYANYNTSCNEFDTFGHSLGGEVVLSNVIFNPVGFSASVYVHALYTGYQTTIAVTWFALG